MAMVCPVTEWVMTTANTIAFVGAGLTGVLAVVYFMRRVWPGIKHTVAALMRLVTIVDSVAGLPAFIAEQGAWRIRTDTTLDTQTRMAQKQEEAIDDHGVLLEVLRSQVQNSHSTNLRDEVTTVLDLSAETAQKVDRMGIALARLTTSDVAQWREIEDTRPNFQTPRAPFAPEEQS
jgi:hypothetical protein